MRWRVNHGFWLNPPSSHDDSYLTPQAAKPDDARSVTRNLRNLFVTAPLRAQQKYNNIMYTVATYLVEQKSGLAFPDFLQEHFFGPLQMHSSHLQPARAKAFGLGERIATGYHWDEKSERYIACEAVEMPEGQGAGSIMTTVTDYLKWVKAMMNKEHPIDEEVYKGLVKMRSLSSTDPEDTPPFTSPEIYAAGLYMVCYRGHLVVSHDGSVTGFGSRHFFVPSLKLGGALFGNADSTGDVAMILVNELIDEILGVSGSVDWDKVVKDENARWAVDPKLEELRRVLREDAEPQKMPLGIYTGTYWNPGYKGLTVDIKDGKLFIDASDRSMGSLVFNHVREQTEYIAELRHYQSGCSDGLIPARFLFHNDKAIKLGIELQYGEEFIWFDRVEEEV